MPAPTVDPASGWTLAPLAARRAAAGTAVVQGLLAARALALDGAWRARPPRGQREPGPLEVRLPPGRVALLRHGSGAWSVGAGPSFRASAPRRGAGLDLLVLRAAAGFARFALPHAARAFEQALWRSSRRRLGLVDVTRGGLAAGRLPPARSADAGARRLLLLHGTFSSTEHAFAALGRGPAAARFWSFASQRYPGGVVGFNHFTLGEDPRANARALRAALGGGEFDAITHSRGGLVLRALVEGAGPRGPALGRAVLAAAPNEGTPLAAPARRVELIALLLNLAEELSPAAIGFGVPLAAAALAWLARGVAVALPGLAAMQPESAFLHALNGPPPPPEGAYAVLCARTRLEGGRLARFADAGLAALFAQPHDLVVPTAGGWAVDAIGRPAIGAERIACFGVNLPGGAHHFDLFARAETADVLTRALGGEPLGLPPVDPAAELEPASAPRRGARAVHASPAPRLAVLPTSGLAREALLELFVIGGDEALLLACHRDARVLEPFVRRGPRWQRIVAGQRRLRAAALGEAPPPGEAALRALGADLFETLLPGDARRLFDEARVTSRELELRVTSTLDWVADAPWELCFDPRRDAWLAAEAHLGRGVYSATPVAAPRRRRGPLRVLVVTASPRALPALSLAAEQRALRAALAPGALAGRVTLEVLSRATPEALARRLEAGDCDVVHFVGHGEHDVRGAEPGRLVLEDGRGGIAPLDAGAARALLCGRGLSLVFLNACETSLHGRGDLARGVAPELARAGVPAVIAHQTSVLDASALRFARAFYESLARGRSIAAAVSAARAALRLADAEGRHDWSTPAVFLRT
ncbi:MAG: CHAT domain-containing protein [Vicinamibacteria bacterium]|jgi:hypothetical protein|nr:CHAT domain-containing protein [Vicinamibacteria bacterium]